MSETRSFKQPREGITGTDWTGDDLLSLEDAAIPRRIMMTGMAHMLRMATLVGNPAPIVQRISGRMRNPQPGDLVVEESTAYRTDEDTRIKAFGILIEHRVEWWETDEEWAVMVEEERAAHERHENFLRNSEYARSEYADEPWEPGERQTDHAWYIQYGPKAGDICRWVNCSFIAIPTDPSAFSMPAGTREGDRVTFTRDDIVGSPADSGFELRARS